MKVEEEAILSYYKELEPINSHPNVMLVRHIEMQQIFVKKILPAPSESVYRTLQALSAPGVPEIYHVINDGDSIIVIEEFINGITISEYLEQHGIFSEEDALKVINGLCMTLGQLHRKVPPIIHRDIKPSNVIIDSGFNPTLIDFDASKTFDSTKNRDTVLMGTAAFAAPEQFGYAQSDARTDIYALGVLFNVMLTGHLPSDKLHMGPFTSVIRKCTSMDPARRYKSIKALSSALKTGTASKRPPGFRTGKVWKAVIASAGYILIICAALCLEVEGNPPLWWVAANRICAFLCMLSILFFMSDYLGISSRLPISSSKITPVKWLGRIFWSIDSVILLMFCLSIMAP